MHRRSLERFTAKFLGFSDFSFSYHFCVFKFSTLILFCIKEKKNTIISFKLYRSLPLQGRWKCQFRLLPLKISQGTTGTHL